MQNHIWKLTLLCTLFCATKMIAQPYGGTIFIDSNIIRSNDPTTFKSISYTGQGMRNVYDRRTNSFININAFLFDVTFTDGLKLEVQVNPEFSTVAAATTEAQTYSSVVGQLPYCLRKDVMYIWIHKGNQPYGGGNSSILIHTGETEGYVKAGILEETLIHEASHTSLDAAHASSSGWIAAQNKDNQFISTYARDNKTREDVAESFLTWIAVRQCTLRIQQKDIDSIKNSIPNRLAYFDQQPLNLSPVCVTGQKSSVSFAEEMNIEIYPNPVQQFLNLNSQILNITDEIAIFTLEGSLIKKTIIDNIENHTVQIDLGELPSGMYYISLKNQNLQYISKKIIKL